MRMPVPIAEVRRLTRSRQGAKEGAPVSLCGRLASLRDASLDGYNCGILIVRGLTLKNLRFRIRYSFVLFLCLLSLCLPPGLRPQASSAPADTPTEANPGRPTVSTPATLTPIGFLQLETGVL